MLEAAEEAAAEEAAAEEAAAAEAAAAEVEQPSFFDLDDFIITEYSSRI
jgi:hypothetical protein